MRSRSPCSFAGVIEVSMTWFKRLRDDLGKNFRFRLTIERGVRRQWISDL